MEFICQKKNRIVPSPNFGGTVISKYLKHIQQFCIIPFPIVKMHFPFPFLLTNKKNDFIFTPLLNGCESVVLRNPFDLLSDFFNSFSRIEIPLKGREPLKNGYP